MVSPNWYCPTKSNVTYSFMHEMDMDRSDGWRGYCLYCRERIKYISETDRYVLDFYLIEEEPG